MSKITFRTSLLLAGLMAAGIASAQAPAQPKGDATDNKVSATAKGSMAAGETSDKTRADVKADGKRMVGQPVNKTGEGVDKAANPYPAGEAKSRDDVKAEAKMVGKKTPMASVNKTGEPNSKSKTVQNDAANSKTGTTDMAATRADVKAEAKAANKP